MEQTHEFIADFELYQKQNFQLSYVDLLMKEAKFERGLSLSVAHMFLNDQLTSRLKMIKNSNKKSNRIKLFASIPLALLLVFIFSCNQKPAFSYYDNDKILNPKPGSIYQACDIDQNGKITLEDGKLVTVSQMKDIIVERRKEEGQPVPKDMVFIISKEVMRKNVSYPDREK